MGVEHFNIGNYTKQSFRIRALLLEKNAFRTHRYFSPVRPAKVPRGNAVIARFFSNDLERARGRPSRGESTHFTYKPIKPQTLVSPQDGGCDRCSEARQVLRSLATYATLTIMVRGVFVLGYIGGKKTPSEKVAVGGSSGQLHTWYNAHSQHRWNKHAFSIYTCSTAHDCATVRYLTPITPRKLNMITGQTRTHSNKSISGKQTCVYRRNVQC